MDNSCLIKLIVETLKRGGVGVVSSLFAQSIVTITSDRTLQFFLEPVVDSSRYFVLKIEDAISNRTAHIGIGFRERDDASNFNIGSCRIMNAASNENSRQWRCILNLNNNKNNNTYSKRQHSHPQEQQQQHLQVVMRHHPIWHNRSVS
jgi:hypothetical protein